MIVTIQQQGAYVRKNGERLLIEKNQELLSAVHVRDITSVMIYGNVQLSTQVVQQLLENGINIHYLSRNGYYYGSSQAGIMQNYQSKMAQLTCWKKESFYFQLSKITVAAKIEAQLAVLQERRHNVQQKQGIQQVKQKLTEYITTCLQTTCETQLGGLEGISAKTYFSVFDQLLPATFPFEKRTRQPAENAVNSVMNFTYSLLEADVRQALLTSGLDLYIGFMHKERYGRASLVYDVMELFRPIIDNFIIFLFRNRKLQEKDFEKKENQSVWLTDHGRGKFLELFSNWKKTISLEKMIQQQVRGLAQAFVKEQVGIYDAATKATLRCLL